MRNKVAKKLRKEAGVQTSTSNRIEYEFLKAEHRNRNKSTHPKIKRSARQVRVGKSYPTKTTVKK